MPKRAAVARRAACSLGGAALVASVAVLHASAAPASGREVATKVPCSGASLVSAIRTANSRIGGTLALAPHCVYHLTAPFAGQDGLPPITKRITVLGNGATIQRDRSATRPFRIFEVVWGGNLDARYLTVRGGKVTGQPELGGGIQVTAGGRMNLDHVTVLQNSSARNGGGVAVLGSATISNSKILANRAAFGGGLVQFGSISRTTISKTVIRYNVARFDGGGLEFGGGAAVVRASHITDNSVTSGDGGGGIFSGAALQVIDSSVDRNHVGVMSKLPGGGGIYNDGPLTLRNTSVSNNRVTGVTAQGGGLYNLGGHVTLSNVRITGNSAPHAPGGVWTDTPIGSGSQITKSLSANCKGSPVIPAGCMN
ncbi:hypothetical protein ABZ876_23605 [Streptomyces sp. NPDC046931]|uniref:hypothetical protein n=1 Tax=Streptomyces sp. NPDC046931 TaxID=3154806 RepID=UPI0033D130B0